VHPGYGFLAENAGFARACEEAGLVFVGPPPEAIELMGRKTAAREAMRAAGVPIVPGTTDPVTSAEDVVRLGAELGYPLIVKAVAGGGGKGMKLVRSAAEAEGAFESAGREGQAAFASAEVYVERYLEDPRHVEVQVLADGHGNVIHFGERDCTIQRRHQKLIEETPSPAVGDELRAQIGQIAVDAARAAGYRSAGTIEGLLSAEGDYYFMEMNTRIQVEHTVTEAVTGIDLIREQLLIAAGEPLSIRQEEVRFSGHAIECRINAEDVTAGFLPSPGTITVYREPGGPGVRVDSGVASGSEISPLYDPMIAKLIVHDVDREHARRRMLRALDEFELGGVKTLLGFHRALLRHPCFIAGATCHGIVESEELAATAAELERAPAEEPVASNGRVRERVTQVEVDGRRFDVKVLEPQPPWAELARRRAERRRSHRGGADEEVVTPMQGTVIAVKVVAGDEVRAGQVLCVIEAMKMENEIVAHRDGVVSALAVAEGQAVRSGDVICVVTTPT
jgi:acetyl-CoA/propionyl-CoA carboxylase, biotin carboxylase, biotin carboxyl carrier protein